MLKNYRQRGAILVLSALALPLTIAMVGLTVDGGNLFYHKSKLQNAVDSAVVAGAHEYAQQRDTTKAEAKMDDYLDLNKGQSTYTIADVKYRQPENTTNSTKITLTVSETVPLYFLKMFLDDDSYQISAKATAQITKTGSNVPKMFEFAMIGGYKGTPQILSNWNRMGDSENVINALIFHTANVGITGKVHTNGPVYLDDTFENNDASQKNYYVSAEKFSCVAKNDADLWSNYRDNYWEHYKNGEDGYYVDSQKFYYADDDTSKIRVGHENDDKITTGSGARDFTWRYYYRMGLNKQGDYVGDTSSSDYIDVSLRSNNAMTSSLITDIKTYLSQSLAERERQHVYIDVDEAALEFAASQTSEQDVAYHDKSYTNYQLNPSSDTSIYPGLTCGSFANTHSNNYDIWKDVYKTVIVDGDLTVNLPANQTPDSSSDHLLLVSLHGNISLQGSSPFYGYIYAPNGTVLIDGTSLATIYGSIVANSIMLTTGGQRVAATNALFKDDSSGSSTGSSNYVVSLVDSDDD